MALYQHKNVILNGQKYNCLLLSQLQLDSWTNTIKNISNGSSAILVNWTSSDLPSYLALGYVFYNPKVNSTTHYLTTNNGGFISEYSSNKYWNFGIEYNSSAIQWMWSAEDGQNDTYISPGIITDTDANKTYVFRIYHTSGNTWNIVCYYKNDYYSIFNGTENLWENITVKLNHNITQATILDLTAATSDKECSYNSNTLFTPGTDFRDFAISGGSSYTDYMLFADNEIMLYKKYESYIQCYSYYHDPTHNGGGWSVYYQGESIGGFDGDMLGKYDKYYGVAFLIDEVNQNGQIIACYSYYPNTSWMQKHHTRKLIVNNNNNQLHKAYLLIKEILTGAKVKVNYMIPEGDYSYCKLTYKADYQPENQDDGTSIDISPNASSVNVEGLDENQLYYFTLFTDKSESEPFPFTTTPDPVPPQYRTYIDNINGHDSKQFFFYNMCGSLSDGLHRPGEYDTVGFFASPAKNYSWCYIYGGPGSTNSIVGNGNTGYYIYPLSLSAVYITSSNDSYTCIFNGQILTGLFGSATYGDVGNRRNGGGFEDRGDGLFWLGGYSDANATTFSFNQSGTLTQIFEYLQIYMRNIDIYVDGELWSKAGK